ncbi:hypothetical protein A4R43_03870 [Amycolatopsis albispora]|uniref:Uncharacterized protein n=2 Tax=Amycolatopsis albispora TaxID=1804986 RepID=A0A344L142_9PSEU|nr:hypothetical protein A4R43_03870 [Amycolatopsis albispora]
MHARKLAAALAVVVPLAGCVGCGSEAPPAAAPTAAALSTTVPTTALSTPAPPTPTTPPTTTTTASAPPPKPADGTNLGACSDGTCEVEVKAGDVIRIGNQVKATPKITALTILDVGESGLTVNLSGGMTTTISGGITINDALNLDTLHVADGRAVIKLSPA